MDSIYTSVQLEMYTESMKVCLWTLRNFKESGKVWWMASHGEAIEINLVRNLQVVLLMFLGVKGLKINKRDNPSKHQIQRQTPLIDFPFYVLQSTEKNPKRQKT